MQRPQKHWDTRAWLVGIIGSGVSVACFVMSTSPHIMVRLNAVLPNGGDWVSGAFAVLSILLLPAVLSGIARRWTFIWGLIPSLLLLVAIGVKAASDHSWKSLSSFFWPLLLVLACAWVIASGPVSLVRWLRVRAVRRHQAVLASYEAMREAASVPQEGGWPPPPDYRA